MYGLHLGSFGTNEEALIERVRAEALFFNEQKRSLVGCSATDKRRINRYIEDAGDLDTLLLRYFSDPEEAKIWLVSED